MLVRDASCTSSARSCSRSGIVLVALNAMRAGLLTRMLGYIGIVAGAMLVLFPLPIVQIFWLGGLGFVLLGRWPGGDPPAWETGQRRAVADARARRRPGSGAEPRLRSPRPRRAPPSSARRKRKKRH